MVDQAAIGASSAVLDVVAQCPSYAAALGYIGVAAAVCLSNWGAAVRFAWSLFVVLFMLNGSSDKSSHI